MIISWILQKAFGVIGWCFRFIPVVPASIALVEAFNYVLYFFVRGASIFFLLVPYNAFLIAVDVVFFSSLLYLFAFCHNTSLSY